MEFLENRTLLCGDLSLSVVVKSAAIIGMVSTVSSYVIGLNVCNTAGPEISVFSVEEVPFAYNCLISAESSNYQKAVGWASFIASEVLISGCSVLVLAFFLTMPEDHDPHAYDRTGLGEFRGSLD